jgi:hypothetical protein
VADLLEAVHVELADEGGEVVVFEVAWQNLLREPRNVFYIEGVARARPRHRLPDLLILHRQPTTSTI